jgi:hypothetical protein
MTELDDSTIGEVCESIETSLWLAESYEKQGATGLARACVESAYSEFLRFDDKLRACGGDALANRVEAARRKWK